MKTLLVTSIIFLFTLVVNAQIPLGFKAGINVNNIYEEHNGKRAPAEAALSFQAGLFTKIKIIEKLSCVPEVMYIQKQASFTGSDDDRIKLSYMEIPILISYKPVNFMAIEAGPSVGFNVGSNTTHKAFQKTDGGILGGVQFYFTKKLSFSSRYYYGLTLIDKVTFVNGPNTVTAVYKYFNQNLQFSLHYYLK